MHFALRGSCCAPRVRMKAGSPRLRRSRPLAYPLRLTALGTSPVEGRWGRIITPARACLHRTLRGSAPQHEVKAYLFVPARWSAGACQRSGNGARGPCLSINLSGAFHAPRRPLSRGWPVTRASPPSRLHPIRGWSWPGRRRSPSGFSAAARHRLSPGARFFRRCCLSPSTPAPPACCGPSHASRYRIPGGGGCRRPPEHPVRIRFPRGRWVG